MYARSVVPAVALEAKVAVLCSSPDHPIVQSLRRWAARRQAVMVTEIDALSGGDFLFLISCGEIIPKGVCNRFRHVLVIHASDLPSGRGWSPHIWAVLEGRDEVPVTVLNATDPVDSGEIWHQIRFRLDGTETFDRINALLFKAELDLMDWAIANCDTTPPRPQVGKPSYRRRRTPEDSRIAPGQTIAEVFDLLRVSDPRRYPPSFDYRGRRYVLEMRQA